MTAEQIVVRRERADDVDAIRAVQAAAFAEPGAADALDEPVVCLLGSPDFYARFGFVRSTEIGIDPPDLAWAEHFLARPLAAFSNDLAGTFKYAAPFGAL